MHELLSYATPTSTGKQDALGPYERVLRIGLLGLGYFGKNYLRILQDTAECEFGGAASMTQGSLDALMADPTIDGLVIATPPQTHAQLSLRALKTGKHVLLEKPAFLSSKEAAEVAQAVKKSGKIFMVGHQYLYNDHFQCIKQHIDDGSFGAVTSFFAEHDYPARDLHTDPLWDAATHVVALADYLFDHAGMKEASGFVTDGVAAFCARYEGGAILNYASNRLTTQKVRRMTLVGSSGMAVYDELMPHKLTMHIGNQLLRPLAPAEPLSNQVKAFLDGIQRGKSPISDSDHAVRITSTLEFIADHLRKA